MNTLLYFHDPMCSWCWGFRPTFEALKAQLPETIALETVLGGLAPDSEEPMAEDMQDMLQQTWRRITEELGTEFNHAFWTDCQPRRSTWPACRAVIAADLQGQGDAMTLAIQQAYYLKARNPSDTEVLIDLASSLDLDQAAFVRDLHSARVELRFQSDLALTAQAPIRGFPSLVFNVGETWHPIALDYQDTQGMLEQITDLQNTEPLA